MQTIHMAETTGPLSFGQQRLWFLDQYITKRGATKRWAALPLAVRLVGRLDEVALEESVNEVLRRHETLRTAFAVVEGQPVCVIRPELHLALERRDLRTCSPDERAGRLEQLIVQEVERPFDLAQAPLLCAHLFQVDDAEYVLLLVFHRIIADERSLRVFLQELTDIYQAFITAMPSLLPDQLSLHYGDFVRQQLQSALTEGWREQMAYWKRRLHDAPPVSSLPGDRARPAIPSYRSAHYTLQMACRASDALRMLSQREDVPLFSTLLAVVAVLLFRYTGQADLVVGTEVAQRACADLIGPCTNMLALRAQLAGKLTFRACLRQVHEVVMGAHEHQSIPFERLVEELQPGQGSGIHPLFQVMAVWQDGPLASLDLEDVKVQPLRLAQETSMVDLTFKFAENVQGLLVELQYSCDLFDEPTIVRVAGQLQTLLESVAAQPERVICELPF